MQVACTDCRYCVEDNTCALDINIPKYLEIYNTYKIDGPWGLQGLDKIESAGKPTNCAACGKCVERCPQSIDIQGIMGELAELIKSRS
jgi:predicted aldo/keto reductase-like oxidoreductase